MRSLREVSDAFSAAATGLTTEQVLQSRERYGSNRLTPLPREPLWQRFLDKFDEPIIKVLLAAALLSILVVLFEPPVTRQLLAAGAAVATLTAGFVAAAYVSKRGRWVPGLLFGAALLLFLLGPLTGGAIAVDGLAVLVAVILATGVAFLSEYRSDREFEILNAHKEMVRAKVMRDGAFQTVHLDEVVVGDRVMLEAGDEVPADGRLVRAASFQVDQSLMTGEAEPISKEAFLPEDASGGPEQSGCLYRGTHIVAGVGEMIVTEVGDRTELGQIARQFDDTRVQHKLTISRELTPLQLKLEQLAALISKVGYLAALAIFAVLLAHGLITGELRWPESGEDRLPVFMADARQLLRYFMYMVIVIVVAVPEGLPMSVTVSLALAMRKMTRANCLVRQLVACETIGSATVICTDKTGTLTQNLMQVVRLSWDGKSCDRDGAEWVALHHDVSQGAKPLDWIRLNAAVNSTAHLEEKGGRLLVVGNSTEGALLSWLSEANVDYRQLRLRQAPLYQIHFTPERKRMASVIERDGRLIVLVKGAPEWVLERCTHYLADDGHIEAWTPAVRLRVQELLREAKGQAMRTLAFGHALLSTEAPVDQQLLHELRETLEQELIYAGFVAIRDPLRAEVKDAVAHCRRAGIDVKMVTGDDSETARAVATDAGLLENEDALVLTSQELNAHNDEALTGKIRRLRVLARARPLDKLRLVTLLQAQNEVVAVTGDGINDAPALRCADVGLAMGRSGTEVAKEASNIVLLDDAFSTIVRAIHWGRALYENIQRFLLFQLTINVSALALAFLGLLLGVEPPFTVLQLLWINVIMDTFAAIALCAEPPRPGLLRQPPKRRDENILTRAMLWNLISTAGFFIVTMLGLLLAMKHYGWFTGPGELRPQLTLRQMSIFFTTYIFFQVWNLFNCRSLVPSVSGLHGLHRNPVLLAMVGVIVLTQVLIVTFGGRVFAVEPLGPSDWLWIAGGTASVLLFAELSRKVRQYHVLEKETS
jgi:Ca2+-transporting ATPase